jgi:hypothetical protein
MNRWSGSASNFCTNSVALDTGSKQFGFHDIAGSGIAHFLDDCTHSLAGGNMFWSGKSNTQV